MAFKIDLNGTILLRKRIPATRLPPKFMLLWILLARQVWGAASIKDNTKSLLRGGGGTSPYKGGPKP